MRDLERARVELLDRGARTDQEIVLLEQLSSTLEELRVVQKDLHEQNRYLLEMRSRLESERRRYAELFELAPDAYLVTDPNGLVLEANRSAGTLLGVRPDVLVGKPLAGFVPVLERRSFRRQLLELSRAYETESLDLTLRSRSGHEFPAAATVVASTDAWGNLAGLRWIVRDATKDRDAEREILELNLQLERRVADRTSELAAVFEARERERERLRRLLERLHEGVIAVDREGHVEFANREAGRILGVEPEWGRPLPEPWESVSLREVARALFEPGATTRDLRIDVDDERTLALTAIPAERGGGAVLVLLDVSEHERRERAERDFISNAAHELRTPLAAIASAVDVLQSGAKEDTEARDLFLGHIERESQRLNRLAHALLVLARAQRGDQPARAETVELLPLLEDVAVALTPQPGVALEVRCPSGLAAVSNATLLAQALISIGANAAKYTKRGRIVLEARGVPGDMVALEVRDTGPGIPAEEQDLVLKRFYRPGPQETEGFGLGLPIAAEAVGAAGGTLELESPPEGGTVVRVIVRGAELITT